MAPVANSVVRGWLPRRVVYGSSTPADLAFEAGGRDTIESHHVVVWVTAEALHHPHMAGERAIERGSDVIERAHLQHEVMQVLGEPRTESDGMVSRIDVQERDVDFEIARQGAPDVIAETKAQDLLEVRSRFSDVVGA